MVLVNGVALIVGGGSIRIVKIYDSGTLSDTNHSITANLSESVSNFDKIGVWGATYWDSTRQWYKEFLATEFVNWFTTYSSSTIDNANVSWGWSSNDDYIDFIASGTTATSLKITCNKTKFFRIYGIKL